jgi:tRNA(Ile)-lysidine synthase
VLLRLARGSGVDGLAGMPEAFEAAGLTWARPFLGISRESLRGFLRAEAVAWAEDPSNEDPRFDRARARAMMAALGDLGLTRARLLRTAGHMARRGRRWMRGRRGSRGSGRTRTGAGSCCRWTCSRDSRRRTRRGGFSPRR